MSKSFTRRTSLLMLSALPVAAKAQVIGEGIVGFGGGGFAPLSADGVTATVDLNFATNQGYNNGVFATPASMVTTTRTAPSAYAADTSGNWAAFGANVPRITNQGLLVEESRTQLVPNTVGGYAALGAAGTVLPSFPSPAGDLTAIQLTDAATNTNYGIYYAGGVAVAASTTYAISYFVKTTNRYVCASLVTGGEAAGVYATFDLQLGVATAGATLGSGWTFTGSSIQQYANGWSRVTVIGSVGTAGSYFPAINMVPSGTGTPATTYSGTGTILYLWTPQIEAGTFPTSPIPNTSGASVTRAVDAVTVTTPPTYGSAATVFGQGTLNVPSSNFGPLIDAEAGNDNSRVWVGRNGATPAAIIDNAGTLNQASASTWPAGSRSRVALATANNNQMMSANGLNIALTATAWPPTTNVSTTHIGAQSLASGSFTFNGYVERIAIWPNNAISTAGLNTLTFVAPSCSNSLNFAQSCNSQYIAVML